MDYNGQGDSLKRAVQLSNLLAMCERASGTSDRWEVVNVSAHRATVGWSNPDEYGGERDIYFALPVIPNAFEAANPYVLVDHVVAVRGGRSKEERDDAWQALDAAIGSAPTLHRSGPHVNDWKTAEEWDEHNRAVENGTINDVRVRVEPGA